jgi:hypothetical protein
MDKVTLEINFSDDGGDSNDVSKLKDDASLQNPFEDFDALSKKDLLDVFSSSAFKDLFSNEDNFDKFIDALRPIISLMGTSTDVPTTQTLTNPLEGITPVGKGEILKYIFPETFTDFWKNIPEADALDNFAIGIERSLKSVWANIDTLSKATEFDTSFVGGFEQKLKDIAEISFDSSYVGGFEPKLKDMEEVSFDSSYIPFLPDDFEEQLEAFFKAIDDANDRYVEDKSMFASIMDNVTGAVTGVTDAIGGWVDWLGKGVAAISGIIVSMFLWDAVIKEALNSLGQFSGGLRRAQAETDRNLMLQSLTNSNRLDEQLAINEASRGELTMALSQFKVEMFDLLSPVIRFITGTGMAIMNILNSGLRILNVIKDLLELPFDLLGKIISLLDPVARNARDDLRTKTKNDANNLAPGLGDLNDLFDLGGMNIKPSDLPPGLREDVTKHPFDFSGAEDAYDGYDPNDPFSDLTII